MWHVAPQSTSNLSLYDVVVSAQVRNEKSAVTAVDVLAGDCFLLKQTLSTCPGFSQNWHCNFDFERQSLDLCPDFPHDKH